MVHEHIILCSATCYVAYVVKVVHTITATDTSYNVLSYSSISYCAFFFAHSAVGFNLSIASWMSREMDTNLKIHSGLPF